MTRAYRILNNSGEPHIEFDGQAFGEDELCEGGEPRVLGTQPSQMDEVQRDRSGERLRRRIDDQHAD